MNVTSGTIEDNPWASVPQEEEDGRDQAETSGDSPRPTTTRLVTCTDWTLHRLVQGFLGFDIVASLFALCYGLALLLQKSPHGNDNQHETIHFPWAAVLCLESSVWLGFRALTVIGSLYYNHIFDRVGLWLASHVSAWASFQALLLCLLTVVFRHNLHNATWWNQHFAVHCSTKLFGQSMSASTQKWFLDKIVPWLWLMFLVTAVLEFPIRWTLYQQYRFRLLQQEEEDLRQTAIMSRVNARRRPWWWSSGTTPSGTRGAVDRNTGEVNDLQRALLEDQTRDVETTLVDSRNISSSSNNNNGLPEWARDSGTPSQMQSSNNQTSSSTSMFSSLFFWRTTNDDDQNPRDDGSVDFASVQEEWASRTQEDPLWWSRDKKSNRPSNASAEESPRVPDFVSADNDGASTVLSTMGLDNDSVSAQSGR